MIKIIDNFLPSSEFEKVESTLMGKAIFPWYYTDSVVHTAHHEEHFQFSHFFYRHLSWTSSFSEILLPCVQGLGCKALLRIKANLLVKTENHVEHGFHVDHEEIKAPFKTAILYVNTNNGYTLFEDGTKVKSEANRLVAFDGSLMHTGATCTDEKIRVVINFTFFV
jgi:hypothetical protein